MKCVALLALSIQMAMAVAAQGITYTEEPTTTTSADTSINDENNDNEQHELAPFLIRLHLVRHGETHANVQNIVLGQGDSPLTDNGVAVASLAAASDMINGKRLRYWRTYCSDLLRAHRTARIVLGLEVEGGGDEDGRSSNNAAECSTATSAPASDDIDLIVDSRLRELAKGAREGYLKKLSYEEAIAMRRREAGIITNNNKNAEIEIPKLESIDEAWERVKKWIDSIIEDASNDYYSSSAELNNGDQGNASASHDNTETDPKIYDVFALSHSALIRTMIHKMVDSELPSNYATTSEGSLNIPNLSRTIIDVRPYNNGSHSTSSPRWTPSLFRLADVSHLQDTQLGGPPYL